MKPRTQKQIEQAAEWLPALKTGADKHRERINGNLARGRVWTDERKKAWTEKAKTSWTPEMRAAAAERARVRHALRKGQPNE